MYNVHDCSGLYNNTVCLVLCRLLFYSHLVNTCWSQHFTKRGCFGS